MTTIEEPVRRQTPLEKMLQKVQTLNSNSNAASHALEIARQDRRISTSSLDNVISRLTAVQLEVKQARRDEMKSRIAVYNSKQALIKQDRKAKIATMELELICTQEKQKEEKKANKKTYKNLKKGIITDALLQQVNRLPEVLVEMIKEYLPYEVRIRDLDFRATPKKLLSCCSAPLKQMILSHCCTMRGYLVMIPYEEAYAEVNNYSRSYYTNNGKEAEIKLLHLLERGVSHSPKSTYLMLRNLHCLINPEKKYKKSQLPFHLTDLTMDDLNDVQFEIEYYV